MRLFFKLFFSFWLIVLLVGFSAGWVSYQLRGDVDQIRKEENKRKAGERELLINLLRSAGVEKLKDHLQSHPHKDALYIVDSNNNEILDRALPPPLKRRLMFKNKLRRLDHNTNHAENRLPDEQMRSSGRRHANTLISRSRVGFSPTGERYLFFSMPSTLSLLSVIFSRNPLIPFFLLGISILAVFFLARHFSLPIKRLRETSLELANGNLRARTPLKRYRIPDELSDFSRDFNFMADRLEQLFHAQKQLIRDISHELRSPLARMRAAVGLLQQEREQDNKNCHRLDREITTLDELIGQIITLSQPDLLISSDKRDWIDLGALIRSIMDDAEFEAGEQKNRLIFKSDEEIVVHGDGQQLHSALENIIRNALHHTPRGGKVHIAMEKNEDQAVQLSITDQGGGVSEPHLSQIFEPFFRSDEARDRRAGGYGLGLAIAAKAIRKHGGVISAQNRPEGGLEIRVRLPIDSEVFKEEKPSIQ
ncbi:MAG: ATP-binding protein [Magnetococcales bacterium]|nr:ATP-binding protein [Magnetococcales bacterium]